MSHIYTEEMEQDVFTGVNKNAYDFVREQIVGYDDYTALTYFGNEISYAKFKKEVNRYANKLKSYGIKKGDVVGLLLGNIPETVYYYYASWAIGAIICPLDPRTNPKGIAEALNRSKVKVLCAMIDVYSDKVSPILNDLKCEKVVLVDPTDEMKMSVKGAIGKALYRLKEYKLNKVDKDFASSRIILNRDFLKNASLEEIKTVYEETEYGMPASHLFTSGTEGDPKAAVHSHENYNRKSKQVAYNFSEGKAGDVFLGIIPFFSAYGSFSGMNNCLTRAMNIVLIPKFKPAEIPELICEHKPSYIIAVPNYWHDFALRIEELMPKYKIKDLSFLKYPVSGGDKLPAKDVYECNKLFEEYGSSARLIRGYGSTEVAGAVATTLSDDSLEDGEYTGVLLPGTKHKFINPETGKIDDNTREGELLISDPSMMIGYLDNEEANKNNFFEIDGRRYFKMGDSFRIDENERLYFEGRIKRAMMRPDGHTVHALPIEEVLDNSPLVDQSCVVGIKLDNMTGTIPTAFVKLKENLEPSEEVARTLDDAALLELSERNRALAYVFVDELPKTLMDKMDYKKLEKLSFNDVVSYIVDDTFFAKGRPMQKK